MIFRWCVLAPLFFPNCSKLYSKLHLALLESLLDTNFPIENVICAQHLASIVKPILKLSEGKNQSLIQLSLDRLAQAIQVIMTAKCIYGKKGKNF